MALAPTSQLGVRNSAPGFLAPGLTVPESYAWYNPNLDAPASNPSAGLGQTLPLIARVFQADGITYVTSFSVLDIPNFKYTMNGSGQPLTLRADAKSTISAVSLGNILQLAEQGGDNTILYTGIVESAPITVDPESTQVELQLNPIGAEAGYTDFDHNYAIATEIAQMVRDAVASTLHLWYTPQSLPDTGVLQTYSFSKSHVVDVLDTCRTFAGPNYFWFIAPNGQVWFQPQGSAAQYVLKQMQHYTVSKSAATVSDLRNSFTVLGGMVPGGSTPLTSVYSNPTSIAQYGRRTIQPNPYYPNVVSQAGVDAIKNTLGTLYDRVFTHISLYAPNFPLRVWPAQPGGALLQYWESASPPTPQAVSGSGTYSAALFVQDVEISGPAQTLVLDQFPSSLDDLDAMLHRIAARATSYPLIYTPAPLNQSVTVTSNFLLASNSGPDSRYVIDNQAFQVFDSALVKRVELGNLLANGVSPAQFGGRVNAADGTPIWDSLGVIGIPKILATVTNINAVQGTNGTFADCSGAVTPTFTLARTTNLVVFAMGRISCQGVNGLAFFGLRCGGLTTTGSPNEVDNSVGGTVPMSMFLLATLGAGSYSAAVQANAQTGGTWNLEYVGLFVTAYGG